MKTPSINLKRTLDVTLKDTLKRLNYLDKQDRKALIDEYKEWLEDSKEDKHPHVLYMNQLNS